MLCIIVVLFINCENCHLLLSKAKDNETNVR